MHFLIAENACAAAKDDAWTDMRVFSQADLAAQDRAIVNHA
jgi:hypothetical protein